jgi:hypothetical protein
MFEIAKSSVADCQQIVIGLQLASARNLVLSVANEVAQALSSWKDEVVDPRID